MAKAKKRRPSENKHKSVESGPRLDAHKRLLSRFYEPLVLLHVLDRNGEQRVPRSHQEDFSTSAQELRRNFLEQLAYICDFVKGGDSVTAVALEAHPSSVIYWIASNSEPSEVVVSHLHEILCLLSNLSSSSESFRRTLEERVATKCVQFSAKRVEAYQTLIRRPLEACIKALSVSSENEGVTHIPRNSSALTSPRDGDLVVWMNKFLGFGRDLLGLCRFSYQERGSYSMKKLQVHIGDKPAELTKSKRLDFSLVHHYIGRLGSHFKAARILVTAGWKIPGLLDNFIIKKQPSPKPPSSPPPTDHLTTLDGIIKRMLSKDSVDMGKYQKDLAFMDVKFNILDRFLAKYKDKNFKPRVHAELILLEFFHKNRLQFVEDDRFIGCSKPACYCCYHYISAHPGGFVRPPSHGIRYLNWRPPDLANPKDALEGAHQRDVLNQVIKQIRLDALRQIEQRRGPSEWRPDSTTGITYSMNEGGLVPPLGGAGRQIQMETSNPQRSKRTFSDFTLARSPPRAVPTLGVDYAFNSVESTDSPEETPAPSSLSGQAKDEYRQDTLDGKPSIFVESVDNSDSDGGVSLRGCG
jgi:OTT_1508-like deaminase